MFVAAEVLNLTAALQHYADHTSMLLTLSVLDPEAKSAHKYEDALRRISCVYVCMEA